jgi:hypothetical protein
VSERYHEAVEELRDLLRDIESAAQDSCYGYFPGGDPRTFSPDPECSTEAEQAAHRAACDAWDRGEREPVRGPHEQLISDGKVIGHVTLAGFGLGVYTHVDECHSDWADRLRRCLERIESEEP